MFSWLHASMRALGLALAVALAVALPAVEAAAQNTFNRDCLPPGGSTYLGQFHAKYADGTNVYDLTQPQHTKFANCDPPPPPVPGPCSDHTMGSFVFAQLSKNGAPPSSVGGAATMRVMVCGNHQTGPTRYYDTEMLQLDLNGGCALMVRESPTLQSTGKTAITDLGGGQFKIDSFFDIFTELSTDCGQTWHPSTNAAGNPYAGHMEIPGTVAVDPARWSNVKVLYR